MWILLFLIGTTVIMPGMKERTAYHRWVDSSYRGLTPTWYPRGFIVLDIPDSTGVFRFIAVGDTTITGITPTRPTKIAPVRPNPFSDELIVASPVTDNLRIYDVAGREVFCHRTQTGVSSIKVDLPSGVYFWRLGTDQGKLTRIK